MIKRADKKLSYPFIYFHFLTCVNQPGSTLYEQRENAYNLAENQLFLAQNIAEEFGIPARHIGETNGHPGCQTFDEIREKIYADIDTIVGKNKE